jgi:hypothetical protein
MMKNLISRIDILQGPLASACARPTVSSSVVLGLFTATHPVMRSLCEEEKWGFLRWKYDIWIWHPLVIQHSYWMLLNICQKTMIMMIQLLNVVIFPYSYCTSTWNPTFFGSPKCARGATCALAGIWEPKGGAWWMICVFFGIIQGG